VNKVIIALTLLAASAAGMAEETPYERYQRFHAIAEQHRERAHQERLERELRKQTRRMEEQAQRERRAKKKGDHPSERGK